MFAVVCGGDGGGGAGGRGGGRLTDQLKVMNKRNLDTISTQSRRNRAATTNKRILDTFSTQSRRMLDTMPGRATSRTHRKCVENAFIRVRRDRVHVFVMPRKIRKSCGDDGVGCGRSVMVVVMVVMVVVVVVVVVLLLVVVVVAT